MRTPSKQRLRPRWQPMRLVAIALLRMGVPGEVVAIFGMVLGILAGISFMGTSVSTHSTLMWCLGLTFCLLRIVSIRVDQYLQHHLQAQLHEEHFEELPERVSDAITLIGFGFATQSNPWLGLAAALAAIFSAYIRSVGMQRGAAKKRASSGPMTRIHRLVLLFVTSILMLTSLARLEFSTSIPQVALWVIFVGCIATILIRWVKIRK